LSHNQKKKSKESKTETLKDVEDGTKERTSESRTNKQKGNVIEDVKWQNLKVYFFITI